MERIDELSLENQDTLSSQHLIKSDEQEQNLSRYNSSSKHSMDSNSFKHQSSSSWRQQKSKTKVLNVSKKSKSQNTDELPEGSIDDICSEEREFLLHYMMEKESVYDLTKQSALILFFECFGTFLMTCIFQSSIKSSNSLAFALGVLCITVLSVKSTGAHYNPAITIIFLFKKKQRVSSKWLGLGYIVFQFGGAIFGAVLALWFNNNSVGVEVYDQHLWSQSLGTEALCSFLISFIYISQSHLRTKLTDDPCIFAFFISCTYTICVFYISSWTTLFFSPVNPAISIAIQLTSFWSGNPPSVINFLIYVLGPLIGSALAALTFEFGYKSIMKEMEGPEDHDIISIVDSKASSDEFKSEPGFACDTKKQKDSFILTDSSESDNVMELERKAQKDQNQKPFSHK